MKTDFFGGLAPRTDDSSIYSSRRKELGDAMSGFKKTIDSIFKDETYDDYIINHSIEDIYKDFELYLKP